MEETMNKPTPIADKIIASNGLTHKRITVGELIKNLQLCPEDAKVQFVSEVLVEDVTTVAEENTKWISFTHNAYKLKSELDSAVCIEISTTTSESCGY
jgi:hypothetical protein